MKNVEVENSRRSAASNSMISALAADPEEQESQPPLGMGQRRMSLRTSLGWDKQKAATLDQHDEANEKGEEEEEYDEEQE